MNECMFTFLKDREMGYSRKTVKKMAEYAAKGFEIHCGNNPNMDRAKKWGGYDLVRIAKTNSTTHGYCISTVRVSRLKTPAEKKEK